MEIQTTPVATPISYENKVEKLFPQNSRGTDQLLHTVISAVAECTGRKKANLEPLHEVINPGPLERAFKPHQDGRHRANGVRTEFTYAGCDILITNRTITVWERESPEYGAPTD